MSSISWWSDGPKSVTGWVGLSRTLAGQRTTVRNAMTAGTLAPGPRNAGEDARASGRRSTPNEREDHEDDDSHHEVRRRDHRHQHAARVPVQGEHPPGR